MSGYFIAFGLRLASHSDSEPSSPPDLIKALHSTVSTGRALVLGGTLLFVVSLVSTVLLIGHSVGVFRVPQRRNPQVRDKEREEADCIDFPMN